MESTPHHRPTQERDSLIAAGVASQAAAAHQGSLNIMGQTIAEALREEGELRGRQETLQMLLEDKFGTLPAELVQRIVAVLDVARLKAATCQVSRLNTLDELQL